MSIKYLLSLLFIFEILSLIFYFPAHAQGVEQRNVSVTALVPPKASDFQFSFITTSGNPVAQSETLRYEILYGAPSAGISSTNTIIVNYSGDKTPDNAYIVDYVIGSASNAYGGVQPVVDTTNRTITWTISSLPADTANQKVTFELRTTGNYSELKKSSFTNRASMYNEWATLPEQTIMQEYLFDPARITPRPTQTPTPPQPTPIPSPVPNTLRILRADLTSISDKAATVNITTNRPTKLRITYGTSPRVRMQTAQTDQFAANSDVRLTNLKPATQYYFQIVASDADRVMRWSEIFTFTTAKEPRSQLPSNNAVVITSGQSVILSDILNGANMLFGILTTDTDYILTYTFSRFTPLTSLEVIIRDSKGIEERTVLMTEKQSRVYTANLRTGGADIYNIFVRLSDPNGNVIEQKVARIRSSPSLSVLEEGSNVPLADARIYVWRFNPGTNHYEPVTSITNPMYTNSLGEAPFLLPPGKYRVEASTLWHIPQTVAFTLGENPGEAYPTIYLKNDPLNLFALFNNLRNLLIDTYNKIFASFQEITSSIRFFNAAATAAVGASVLLSSILFSLRTDIRWKAFIPFMMFLLFVTAKKYKEAYLYGSITDPENNPVNLARVEIIDLKTNISLTHTITNKAGHFAVRNTFTQQYIKLLVTKEGFEKLENIIETTTRGAIKIQLAPHSHIQTPLASGIRHILGEFFELGLLLSLLAELVFLASFGLAKTLPFFALSFINLLMWLLYIRQKHL